MDFFRLETSLTPMNRNLNFRSSASTRPAGKLVAMDSSILSLRSAAAFAGVVVDLLLEGLRLPDEARTTAMMPATSGAASSNESKRVSVSNEMPAIDDIFITGDHM